MEVNADRQQSKPARIILAEDHPLFRSALVDILSRQSGLEVVGEAANGLEALELCRSLHPDLVLTDLRMPKADGLEATRTIKQEFPTTIVLILTAAEDPNVLSEALKAGAAGYILKYSSAKQITDAILQALAGESPLNQEVAAQLLRQLLEETPPPPTTSVRPVEEYLGVSIAEALSPREVEVLRLVAQGKTNGQIARELLISVSTVKKHVQQLITKLGVSDRTQAAVRAIELGLHRESEPD